MARCTRDRKQQKERSGLTMNKSDFVILICGFGRCGSSLIMQMLKAAGIDVDGTPPYYETEKAYDGQWVSEQRGRAVKILEPHRHDRNFPDGDYRCIWLDRDHKQQALSHVKFHTEKKGLIIENTRHARAEMRKFVDHDRPIGTKMCERLGPTLYLRFEDILEHPNNAAVRICGHCDIPMNKMFIMAGEVYPREPECRPTLDLELALEKG